MATPASLRMPFQEPSPTRKLLVRLGAVLSIALCSGVAFAWVGLFNLSIQVWALNLATAAGLGLISGLASRLALRNYRWLLRLATALAAAVVSMIFVGWITWGFAGITPRLTAGARADWVGLARVATGILGATLALRAWAPPTRQRSENPSIPAPTVSPSGGPSGEPVRQSPQRPGNPPPSSGSPFPWVSRGQGVRTVWASRLDAWRRILPNHPPGIRLTGAEEHRCPYCLEVVSLGDPRGVVVCPVCHTQHHADCWAITGVCQVPHHHA